jgi:N-acetyl-anhydromuramyl-L-alanine amidase AmpD
VVLHGTEGPSTNFYQVVRNLAKKTVARYVIGKKRGQIARLIPDALRASHARVDSKCGNSEKGSHNDQTVGIELHYVGENDTGAFTDWQYDTVAQLCFELMMRFGLQRDEIVPHAHISDKRQGKEDPRDFDRNRFDKRIASINARIGLLYPEFKLHPTDDSLRQSFRRQLR